MQRPFSLLRFEPFGHDFLHRPVLLFLTDPFLQGLRLGDRLGDDLGEAVGLKK